MFPYMIATENCALVHRWIAYLVSFFALFAVLGLFVDGASANILMALLLLSGLAALNYAIARAARRGERWARIACGVTGVFLLIGFPIGTLIGGYLLMNLSWESAAERRQRDGINAAIRVGDKLRRR